MKMKKFDNAAVITGLELCGCRVGIRHHRGRFYVYNIDHDGQVWQERRINQTGGITEVVIFVDGQQFVGEAKNPKTQQYNKNFGVHVALQRAIKAMNKANNVDESLVGVKSYL